jgi:excisionase family DNA binding protein
VYKVSELAKLIKVNRSTIYDWINKGKLKATVNTTKIRKKFTIKESDFEEFKKIQFKKLTEKLSQYQIPNN